MEESDRPRGEASGNRPAVTFLAAVLLAYLLVGLAAYQVFELIAAHV
jgi:hypothetical protein